MCLEFSHVALPGAKEAYDLYSFEVIPRMGQAVTGDAESYRYLVESIRQFPKQVRPPCPCPCPYPCVRPCSGHRPGRCVPSVHPSVWSTGLAGSAHAWMVLTLTLGTITPPTSLPNLRRTWWRRLRPPVSSPPATATTRSARSRSTAGSSLCDRKKGEDGATGKGTGAKSKKRKRRHVTFASDSLSKLLFSFVPLPSLLPSQSPPPAPLVPSALLPITTCPWPAAWGRSRSGR